MKNITLLLAILVCSFCQTINAQTIGNQAQPEIGDMLTTASAEAEGIGEGPSGAGVVWDFTNLNAIDAGTSSTFVAPSDTPHADEFPSANLALMVSVAGSTTYSYYQVNGGESWSLGTVSDFSKSDFTQNPELLLKTPFGQGEQVNDDYEGFTESNGTMLYHSGSKTLHADGGGTLKLPNAEFTDVVRVKTTSTRVDSVDTGASTSLTTTTNTLYSWYVPGVSGAVLNVVYTEGETVIHIPGMDPIITEIPATKTVTFNPDATPMASAAGNVQVTFNVAKVYPTPADQEVYLTLNATENAFVEANLVSLMGRQVSRENWQVLPGEQTFTFNVEGLPSGIYLLNLKEGSAQVTYRIVKR